MRGRPSQRGQHAQGEGIAGTHPDLGDYVAYGERWSHSLIAIAAWAAVGFGGVWLSAVPPSLGPDRCTYVRGVYACEPTGTDLRAFLWLGIAALAVASFLVYRRLARRPGVRVGERGIEDRTGLVFLWSAEWDQVIEAYPSVRHRFTRSKRIDLAPSAIHHAWDSVRHSICLTGLSATLAEVEATIDGRLEAARRPRRAGRLAAAAQKGKPLLGVEFRSEDGEILRDVTSQQLHVLLSEMRSGSFLVESAPSLRGKAAFLQTAKAGEGLWSIEYRDQDGDVLYGAEGSMAQVEEIMGAWAFTDTWRDLLVWAPVKADS